MCRLPQEVALPLISVFEIVSHRTGWIAGVYGENPQLVLTTRQCSATNRP